MSCEINREFEKTCVVVTGVGMITPLGETTEETWRSVRSGQSAVSLVDDPDVGKVPLAKVATRQLRGKDPFIEYALTAAEEAVRSACLDFSSLDPERTGVLVSSSKGGMTTFWQGWQHLVEKGPLGFPTHFCDHFLPHMASSAVADLFRLVGPRSNVVSACSTGLQSIIQGVRWIERGECDIVLCGSTEASHTPLVLSGFKQMGVLSRSGVPRPYDVRRDGFGLGEGACVLVLESERHAKKRGAALWGRILGYGLREDTVHPVHFGEGAESIIAAIRLACGMAGMGFEQIQYINGHGTGTQVNDLLEAKAIHTLSQEVSSFPLVSSSKGMLGHLLGASGSVELGLCLLSLRAGWFSPSLYLEEPDPTYPLNYVLRSDCERPSLAKCLKLSFGFGGHVSALVLEKAA